MWGWPGFFAKNFVVVPAGIEAAQAMARLHEEDFIRPWTDGEFLQLLKQETVFAFLACQEGKGSAQPAGFVLARLAAGEAEILTIAVARAFRRRGIGRLLMDAVMRKLHGERAESLFLEVDETNAAAIALYRRFGFRKVGERKAYYEAGNGRRNSAIVMRVDFR